ncbi:hypothetical protein, partial [Salmonella enterica]|uniref:hypothetical protein n=1 Tax=Salmonella enterica TaxID=28901 RepID=UPI003CF17F34
EPAADLLAGVSARSATGQVEEFAPPPPPLQTGPAIRSGSTGAGELLIATPPVAGALLLLTDPAGNVRQERSPLRLERAWEGTWQVRAS